MAAVVQILCGSASSEGTARLLERYRAVVHQGESNAALWLGPTRRTVEALHSRLLPCLPAGVAPHPLTFEDFVNEIVRASDPSARPLAHAQGRLLADNIVADLRGRLSHFHGVFDTRGFTEAVFALLAELKQHEIWPEPFNEAVGRAGAAGSKGPQCALIYQEYQERLIRHRLYDLAGRTWYARELLGQGHWQPFEDVRAVFLDGFTEFTRSQHEMLALLARHVEELWLTLPGETGEERAELFTRTRQTLDRLQTLAPRVLYLPRRLPRGNGRAGAGSAVAGLAHLERELFRPVRTVRRAADAGGLTCIDAPGLVGETRLVGRQIKTLLLEGTPPDDILVTMRDLTPYADLIHEVFAEYDIPVDIDGIEPLHRNPAVATLLRALRVPEQGWKFAQVTALLRSGYFRPDWPEMCDGPEMAQHAEVLLRLLAEPRGREATLTEVAYWAEHPRPGLEDEQAEESRRQRTHQLAQRCRCFLERFYRAWDGAPARGRLADHVAWVRSFAGDIGIRTAAADDPRDAAALARLWDEMDEWVRLDALEHKGGLVLDRARFQRALDTLAAEAGLPRTPRGPGRVRVLPALLVRGLRVPHVFVMGLGEGSFPQLSAPHDLFDESERQAFRDAGLGFPGAADRMPDEMLLFYQVVTAAEKSLVLSYPALDDKGQELLPSSFLATVRECFVPKAISTLCRKMLIEGLDRDEPLCPAEQRVQLARTARGQESLPTPAPWPLAPDMLANLQAAGEMVRRRTAVPEHGVYDGLLRDPRVVANVAAMYGPDRILSPTALEHYIACPFKFFLGNVLHLEPLEEPSEEIESSDRGLACHRALARLHKNLLETNVDEPTEEVEEQLLQRLDEAVAECAIRASPPGEALWKLEGQRLKRVAARYREHWEAFKALWKARGLQPRVEYADPPGPNKGGWPTLEVSFGLPPAPGEEKRDALVIASDAVTVRISGRIDRVDISDFPDGTKGFWVIDYKTGRGSNYTGPDLEDFVRLQLTLYALAVEQVLLAGKKSRPLGLVYWLVTESGPKVALPGHRKPFAWLEDARAWPEIRKELCSRVLALVRAIRQGQFPLAPRSEKCTETCDFGQVCRIMEARSAPVKKSWKLELPTV